MTPATVPAEAITLLEALFPDEILTGDVRINLRGLVHGAGPEDADSRFFPSVEALRAPRSARTLAAWNGAQRRSVYLAPGLRRGAVGTKAGVVGLTAFWADLDAKDFLGVPGPLTPTQRAEGKRLARQRLAAHLPTTLQPSIIVDSAAACNVGGFSRKPPGSATTTTPSRRLKAT